MTVEHVHDHSASWMPHGFCFQWDPQVFWPMVVGNGAVAFAYFALPFVLLHIARRRRDLLPTGFPTAFAGFILLCGCGHALKVLTLWLAWYRLEAVWDLLTGIESWIVVAWLYRLLPRVLALGTADQMAELQAEVRELSARLSRASDSDREERGG